MPAGRKPKPTAQHAQERAAGLKRGNDALNTEDPLARETLDPTVALDSWPPAPAHFSKRARELYHEFAGFLRDYRCLTYKTLYSVRVLAHLYAELEDLQERVTRDGHTVEGAQGIKRNPDSQAYDTVVGRVTSLFSELGFTPSGASRVKPSMVAPSSNKAPTGVSRSNPAAVLAHFRTPRQQ